MEFIFDFFYTPFDRGFWTGHEYGLVVFFGNFFQVKNFKIEGSGQKPKWYKMGSYLATFTIGHGFTNKMHLIFEISVQNWIKWHVFCWKIIFVKIFSGEGTTGEIIKKNSWGGGRMKKFYEKYFSAKNKSFYLVLYADFEYQMHFVC